MKRFIAYLIILIAYVIACLAGYYIFDLISNNSTSKYDIVLALLLADISTTIIIWLFSLIFKNSSFYDPYWSLIPWLIILFICIRYNLWSITNILFLIIFGFWSFRLTINWAYTCKDIKTQDWRYTMYKENNKPLMWHIINFFGIQLMPTLFVFLALIPGIFLVLDNREFNPLILIGLLVIIIGTLLELIADISMHKHRNSENKNNVLRSGLWKYSRHPNYLGEISIWLGVYLISVVLGCCKWYWIVGFIMMSILFIFISIPLAEKRQLSKRAEYLEYKNTTSMLLILPLKRNKDKH